MQNKLVLFFLSLIWVMGCTREVEMPSPSATPVPSPTWPIGVSLMTRARPTTPILQTTPTPLPTPTITPSPTPVLIAIEPGDTLLGIAIKRGTTVDAIIALNPGIQPNFLQIGQQIVIPPPETAVLGQIGPPIPIQVQIQHVNSYLTPVGSLWLVGEVLNESAFPVADVIVEIGLLDDQGVLLSTVMASAAVPVILPGQTAPFSALVSEPPSAFAQPRFAVIAGMAVADMGNQYLDMVIEGATLDTVQTGADSRWQVSGQLRNQGSALAAQVRLLATFYDAQGAVAGYQQWPINAELQPGQSIPFTYAVILPGGTAVRATYTAFGLTVSESIDD